MIVIGAFQKLLTGTRLQQEIDVGAPFAVRASAKRRRLQLAEGFVPFGYRDFQQGTAAGIGDLGAGGESDSLCNGVVSHGHRIRIGLRARRRNSGDTLPSLPFLFLSLPFLFPLVLHKGFSDAWGTRGWSVKFISRSNGFRCRRRQIALCLAVVHDLVVCPCRNVSVGLPFDGVLHDESTRSQRVEHA